MILLKNNKIETKSHNNCGKTLIYLRIICHLIDPEHIFDAALKQKGKQLPVMSQYADMSPTIG